MVDQGIIAKVTSVEPASNPHPSRGKASDLQEENDDAVLWRTDSLRPVTIRYTFHESVEVTAYTVQPPANLSQGALGWEIEMFKYGRSLDAWNRVYHGARSVRWAGPAPITVLLERGVKGVGTIDVTFGEKQRFDQVGFGRFFFRGSLSSISLGENLRAVASTTSITLTGLAAATTPAGVPATFDIVYGTTRDFGHPGFVSGPATAGLPDGVAWAHTHAAYSTLSGATSLAARLRVAFNRTGGVLLEAGGQAAGLALYVCRRRLYLDYGPGSGFELSVPEPTGTRLIELSVDDGGAIIWVDGVRAASHRVALPGRKVGQDAGGIGKIHATTGLRPNKASWTKAQGAFTGAVQECVVFRNASVTNERIVDVPQTPAETHAITGLVKNTPYYVWVRAKDARGNETPPRLLEVATGNDDPPAGLDRVSVKAVTRNSILLQGISGIRDPVDGIRAVRVYYSEQDRLSNASFVDADPSEDECLLAGLADTTLHYVWVQAVDGRGTAAVAQLPPSTTFTANPPTEGLERVGVALSSTSGTDTVAVSGLQHIADPNGVVAVFVIYNAADSLSGASMVDATAARLAGAPLAISGLRDATQYHFWVEATDRKSVTTSRRVGALKTMPLPGTAAVGIEAMQQSLKLTGLRSITDVPGIAVAVDVVHGPYPSIDANRRENEACKSGDSKDEFAVINLTNLPA